jgi:hypothetical protein
MEEMNGVPSEDLPISLIEPYGIEMAWPEGTPPMGCGIIEELRDVSGRTSLTVESDSRESTYRRHRHRRTATGIRSGHFHWPHWLVDNQEVW